MIQVMDSIPWVRCASGNVQLVHHKITESEKTTKIHSHPGQSDPPEIVRLKHKQTKSCRQKNHHRILHKILKFSDVF